MTVRRQLRKKLKDMMKTIFKSARESKGSSRFNSDRKSKSDVERRVKGFLEKLSTLIAQRFCGFDILGKRVRTVKSSESNIASDVRRASNASSIRFSENEIKGVVIRSELILKELKEENIGHV